MKKKITFNSNAKAPPLKITRLQIKEETALFS